MESLQLWLSSARTAVEAASFTQHRNINSKILVNPSMTSV